MNRADGGFLCLIGLLLVGGVLGVHWMFVGKPGAVYDINKAQEWLWKARASTDLEVMADYMEKGLLEIEHRHGNPSWWFPTVSSDFDVIKAVIQENIDSAREVASIEEKGSYGYQRAIDNIEEATIEVNEHLDTTTIWLSDWTQDKLLLLTLWAVMVLICMIVGFG